MTTVELTDAEQAMLEGRDGPAAALAMRVVVALARVAGARRLVEIASAHVDSCLYHGQAGLDFAERLVELGGRVSVPTTLNVGSLDLLHPGLVRGDAALLSAGRRLMDAYVALGARPTWTCAPYQQESRPAFGEHVAWAESNAIVFANSVLGARTDRYGDFLDICAAITGRAPHAGLHLDEHRRAQVVLDLTALSPAVLIHELAYPVLGHLAGQVAGTRVPVLVGLPADTGEDALKALGAAAASSGGVAMFHAVGVTPEAPSLEAALHGRAPDEVVQVDLDRLRAARDELTTYAGDRVDAVSIGTPHASLAELARLAGLLGAQPEPFRLPCYVSTSRAVLEAAAERGYVGLLQSAGATLVTDTCTYVTPILRQDTRVVMTNSAKWAYYAPGNLGVEVVLAGLEDCVATAQGGRATRVAGSWPDV